MIIVNISIWALNCFSKTSDIFILEHREPAVWMDTYQYLSTWKAVYRQAAWFHRVQKI